MAVRSGRLNVDTTPLALILGEDQDRNPGYRDSVVRNVGDVVVYLGGQDVTPANGFPLPPNEAMSFDQAAPDSVPYVVAEASGAVVSVLELGV